MGLAKEDEEMSPPCTPPPRSKFSARAVTCLAFWELSSSLLLLLLLLLLWILLRLSKSTSCFRDGLRCSSRYSGPRMETLTRRSSRDIIFVSV